MPVITIPTPTDFSFLPTVISHGWCELPPYHFDHKERVLERIQELSNNRVVKLVISADPGGQQLVVGVEGMTGQMSNRLQSEIRAIVIRCLNVEQNLHPFYKLLHGKARYQWVKKQVAGRLLASPTVWEDLTKTLLTTNTTWNVTVQMCQRLAELGAAYKDGGHAFPTAEQVASLGLEELGKRVRIGYRAPYLYELATAITEGRLDVEEWRDTDLPTNELHKQIKSLKGFGDYAVGSTLKLLGRFDRLGIDTSCRDVFRAQLNDGKTATDDQIRAYYEQFGEWRGLVMWMDIMNVNLNQNLKAMA